MAEKLTRRAALASIGSGAAVAMFGTAGFDEVAAGRDVSVDVSGDVSNAYLGVSTNDGVTVEDGNPATVGELTNNFDESLTDITLDIIEIGGASNSALQVEPISQIDTAEPVVVSCNEEVNADGSDVTFLVDAAGNSVAVDGVIFNVTVDIRCQPVAFGVEGSVSQTGKSGKVNFNINTDGDLEATITSFSIQTKNDLSGVGFTDQGTTFDDQSLDVTFNDSIPVQLKKFDTSGPNKIEIEDTDFVDPNSQQADIVVHLDFQNYSSVSLGIDATLS